MSRPSWKRHTLIVMMIFLATLGVLCEEPCRENQSIRSLLVRIKGFIMSLFNRMAEETSPTGMPSYARPSKNILTSSRPSTQFWMLPRLFQASYLCLPAAS